VTTNVSIVTGAGRGIGRAISLALAETGPAVALLARSAAELDEVVATIADAGGHARAFTVDVTDAKHVAATVAEIERALGPISLVVNNAGLAVAGGPLWETDPDDWRAVLSVNLMGPYLLARYVLPGMIERRAGRIVNMASNAGIGPFPYATAYSTSKAGLLRFTDCLHAEVADFGVHVFAISPGWVWTGMTEGVAEMMKRQDPSFEGIDDRYVFPPEAAAGLVVRLASGEADALAGRFIHVSDDLDAMITNAASIEEEDTYALRLRK